MKKSITYYSEPRKEIIRFISRDVIHRVLDVGCGTGVLGEHLQEQKSVEIIGIEQNLQAAEIARQSLDKVLVGDVENMKIPYPNGYFDCIILADVLEHLKDPESFLQSMNRLLSSKGILIISVPNIRHFTVILNLLFNCWSYQDRGIFDQDHLRFFSRKTIFALLKKNRFQIVQETANYRIIEKGFNRRIEKWIALVVSLYFFRAFYIYQIILKVKKIDAPD